MVGADLLAVQAVVTTPAAAPSEVPWWVMQNNAPSHGSPQFKAIQSATRPKDTAVSSVAAGPFPTKAAADAWIAAQQSPDFPSLPNPLSFLSTLGNIGHWAGIFTAAVTDVHTWISVGWLGLGLGLLLLGIVLWILSTKTARSAIKGGVTAAGTVPLAA